MTDPSDAFFNDPNRQIRQLEKQAVPRAQSQILGTDDQVVNEQSAFPVQAGNSIIRSGLLTRQPVDKDYGAKTIITGLNSTYIEFNEIAVRKDIQLSSGIIIGGKMTKQNLDVENIWLRIWLYLSYPGGTTSPALADGTAFNLTWSRRSKRIGYIDFNNFERGLDCSESAGIVSVGQNLLFELEDSSLFGILETRNPCSMKANEQIESYLFITSD